MAIILKQGKTFNPTMSEGLGIDMTGNKYYGVIDSISYDKSQKQCDFQLYIYVNKDTRYAEGQITEAINFSYNGEVFDEKVGTNGLTTSDAYAKVLADDRFAEWKADE